MSAAPSLNSVFLITHEFYPKRGGIATFTEEIAKATCKLGYNVEVWAQSAPPEKEKDWPFKLHRLPVKGTHDLTSSSNSPLSLSPPVDACGMRPFTCQSPVRCSR